MPDVSNVTSEALHLDAATNACLLRSMYLLILCLSSSSVVPSALQVGQPVKRSVRLINQSDGILQYNLLCELQDDQFESAADSYPVELLPSGAVVEELKAEELWVNEPEGVLAAR
jgi:hypothetical protein